MSEQRVVWVSKAQCRECDFKVAMSPAIDKVDDQVRAHKNQTGHSVQVEDDRKSY